MRMFFSTSHMVQAQNRISNYEEKNLSYFISHIQTRLHSYLFITFPFSTEITLIFYLISVLIIIIFL